MGRDYNKKAIANLRHRMIYCHAMPTPEQPLPDENLCRSAAICQLTAPENPDSKPCGSAVGHFSGTLAERECYPALQGRFDKLQTSESRIPKPIHDLQAGWTALELSLVTSDSAQAATYLAKAEEAGRQVLDTRNTHLPNQLSGGLLHAYLPLFAKRSGGDLYEGTAQNQHSGLQLGHLLGVAIDAPIHPGNSSPEHFSELNHRPCTSNEEIKNDHIAALGVLMLLERETRSSSPRMWPMSPREARSTRSQKTAAPVFYTILNKSGPRAAYFRIGMSQKIDPSQVLSRERPNAPLTVNAEAAMYFALHRDLSQSAAIFIPPDRSKLTETLELFDALRSARPLTKIEAEVANRMAEILQKTVSKYTWRVGKVHGGINELALQASIRKDKARDSLQ